MCFTEQRGIVCKIDSRRMLGWHYSLWSLRQKKKHGLYTFHMFIDFFPHPIEESQ